MITKRFLVQVAQVQADGDLKLQDGLAVVMAESQEKAALAIALQFGLTKWNWLGYAFQPWMTSDSKVEHVLFVEEVIL